MATTLTFHNQDGTVLNGFVLVSEVASAFVEKRNVRLTFKNNSSMQVIEMDSEEAARNIVQLLSDEIKKI